MEPILYLNGCPRQDSRTDRLARACLSACNRPFTERKLTELALRPLREPDLIRRDRDWKAQSFSHTDYDLAKEFAAAETILLAAPLWDCSFPAIVKLYLEQICINGITFSYDSKGQLQRLCCAERLIYCTTAGGFLGEHPSIRYYWEELCGLFSIPKLHFFCAEGLDVFPEQAEDRLVQVQAQMQIRMDEKA